jgi:hypothetical protein
MNIDQLDSRPAETSPYAIFHHFSHAFESFYEEFLGKYCINIVIYHTYIGAYGIDLFDEAREKNTKSETLRMEIK